MKLLDWIFGRFLATSEEKEQRVGAAAGIPMLGLDALSSSAYGPEAALTVLLPLGALGLHYVLTISWAIIVLLFVVFLSYRQTIQAYPGGGGSYTVAKENLGRISGLLAASALLLDYILVVAVGISAGVGALISAVPELQPHTLGLCLIILIIITLINLRGVKESGLIFMMPTYAFIISLLGVLAVGFFKVFVSHGHPTPVEALPVLSPRSQESVSMWLLLRAFASGCTAMTGVEAVSNGVKAFKEPVVKNAQRTLLLIILILIIMLGAIAHLAVLYGVGATEPGQVGYESMISQLVRAIVGKSFAYYFTMASTIAILALSANTAFADFPRLCQILANDNYLPHGFAERGRRLVFSQGIIFLSVISGLLIFIFDGVTDRLIPLFAIGAFLAFTMSQTGMVVHWLKQEGKHVWLPIWINAIGALATGVTLIVVLVSKFSEGGWITAIIVPLFLLMFIGVRRHYFNVASQIFSKEPLNFDNFAPPIVIVPVKGWNKITRKALGFASQLSDQIYAIHVESLEKQPFNLETQWVKYVEAPAKAAGAPVAKLVNLANPYRRLFGSMLDFIDDLEKKYPTRRIAIVVPNLSEHRWYHSLLHNQRALLLNAALRLRRDPKIVVLTVPWYLDF
jgi:amino acid transporter